MDKEELDFSLMESSLVQMWLKSQLISRLTVTFEVLKNFSNIHKARAVFGGSGCEVKSCELASIEEVAGFRLCWGWRLQD